MKITLATLCLIVSVNVFAQNEPALGEGANPGCNPSEWTCDNDCQVKKARACGLNLSDLRGPKEDSSEQRKKSPKSKAGSEQ